jgi:hypothetical protein
MPPFEWRGKPAATRNRQSQSRMQFDERAARREEMMRQVNEIYAIRPAEPELVAKDPAFEVSGGQKMRQDPAAWQGEGARLEPDAGGLGASNTEQKAIFFCQTNLVSLLKHKTLKNAHDEQTQSKPKNLGWKQDKYR